LALVACLALASTGCFPTQPVYWNDSGDLSYYLDRATAVEYPDVETASLDEVTQSRAPITIAEPQFDSFWDLTLEEAVSIALQNSKVIRGYGTPGLQSNRVAPGIDNLANGPAGAGTTYNVAIRESEPGFIASPGQIATPGSIVSNTTLESNQGVEAALADFDAQVTTSLFWDRTDSPRNNTSVERVFVFEQDSLQWQTELSKRTADGTQLFLRNLTSYTDNNIPLAPFGFQALRSVWQTALEAEVRQPLLRGRGAFINRMPIIISRIGTDQEIANLEAQLQNMLANVEIRYWDLYCAYRNLDAARYGRDSALTTWRIVQDKYKAQTVTVQREAQAREQYYFFRAEVERAWSDLLDAESNLRWLLGIASTDGRLIRPIDEPIKAPIQFDYCQSLEDALACRPELRQERWEVKKRQLSVAYAKNSLLPTVNAFATYRWLGVGDRLVSYDDPTPDFPLADSGAWNELFGGNYQEFRLGVEAGLPVGFRRELANVKNAELKLAREMARAEDMELDVTRELQHALRALDTNYQLAQTNFNRWASTTTELKSLEDVREIRGETLDVLLEAQRRRAQAEIAYHQALCEYNKVIALIHRRKGTTLSYSGVQFDEGPWAGKAYYDAEEYARRRSASREINYGWTRPEVISQGPSSACQGCQTGDCESAVEFQDVPETILEGEYFEPIPSQGVPGEQLEELPEVQPGPLPQPNDTSPDTKSTSDEVQPTLAAPDSTTKLRIVPPATRTAAAAPASASESVAKIKWEKLGLSQPPPRGQTTQATIRVVNHEE
jgi:outer membrane protein TolC